MNDRACFLGPEHILRLPNQGGSFAEGRGYDMYWISAHNIRANCL